MPASEELFPVFSHTAFEYDIHWKTSAKAYFADGRKLSIDEMRGRVYGTKDISGVSVSTETSTANCANGGDYFMLRTQADPNYCLDIPNKDANNGIDLILYECHGGENQLWRFDSNGRIRSKLDDRKCIDPQGPSTENGAPAQIWSCADNYIPQKWRPTNALEIRSQWNYKKCFDVAGAKPQNNGKVIMWDCHGGDNQKWDFSAVLA